MMPRTVSRVCSSVFLVGDGEEEIDVGEGEEVFAAVSAEGEKGDIGGRLTGEGSAPHLTRSDRHRRAPPNGRSAVSGTSPQVWRMSAISRRY